MDDLVEQKVSCVLKYVVRGVESTRENRSDLKQELLDTLNGIGDVTILPVVQGLAVEIEMDDIAPFTRTSFEPFVADHVLPEAVKIRCDAEDFLELQLVKSKFN
ncbi:MAG: hypothetical protein AAF541_23435 [Pseudomonadota bacterium]